MRLRPHVGSASVVPHLTQRVLPLSVVALLLLVTLGPQPVSAGYGPTVAAPAPRPAVSAGGDPLIGAAGDIACDPASSSFNGGLGTSSNCRMKYTSDLLINAGLSAVVDLGDNQYYCGGLAAFQQSYDLSWGRVKSITFPSVGNHEYLTSGGTGCTTANTGAAGYFNYFGAAAGDPSKGYYSYDIGSWHLIALNTQCSKVGGCGSTSPQGQWLQADLAAHANACTLAYWHIPLYSSGGRASSNSQSFFQALYASNADLVLTAHDHLYERFAPQDALGNLDTARGLREFVVGTGGADHTSFTSTVWANSEVRNADTYGVLKLTLHATSYDWSFVPEAGKTFTDSGTTFCHTSTAPPPGTMTGTVIDSVTGLPVAGATLSYSGGNATSGSTGAYTFSNVPVGTYTSQGTYGVRVTANNYTGQTQTITVTSGSTTTQNIALVPLPGTIKGIVTDASTAKPIANATVSYTVSGVTTSATTSSTGSYTFSKVTEGTYSLTASATNYASSAPVSVTVGPGATATQNFSLAPPPGSITGTVTDAGTSAPIASATVSYTVSGVTTSATTNSSGVYTLANVPPGSYAVTASAANYSGLTRTVVVGAGASVTQNFALSPLRGWINGTVSDASTGKPIANATVGYSGGVTTTNAVGAYTLASVPPGTYTVTASATNYTSSAPASVTVVANAATAANFSLAPLPGSITGVVIDASTSAPIANATVSYTVSGVTTSATTNSSGVYTLTNVPEGSYSLTASAANYTSSAPVSVTVGPGATATQNFSLQPLPGSISGTVADAGTSAPIANATVSYTVSGVTTSATTNSSGVYTLANVAEGTYSLTASATNYTSLTRSVVVGAGASVTQNFALSLLPGSISGTVTDASTTTPIGGATVSYSGGSTTTNATGAYTLANVPPGTITVTVSAANYTSSAPVTVTVGPGATTTQNFSLTPLPGSITGTVTDAATSAPIANATVSYTVSGVTTSAATNSSGVYTLANVPEGTYSLTASAANYTSSAPVSVTVGPGATATQNFSLQPLPGSITGTVTDSVTATLIAGATVSYSGGSTTTDASGAYTLFSVPPGTYTVTASAAGYTSQGMTVTVVTNTAAAANFSLQPLPGSITGVVSDNSTSAPIANATVSYTVGTVTTSATTNSSGVYTLANVPEGTYSLTASATNYTSSAPVSVTVGPGASATQNFSLQPLPGSITGVVSDVSTSAPIANATVSYTVSAVTTSATTNSSGVYTLANVPEGTYSLTASAIGYSSLTRSVVLGAGASVTQNFALALLPGAISGTVSDASTTTPIGGATVSYSGGSTTTNASGAYTLANVPAGTYTLTASATGYTSQIQLVTVVTSTAAAANFSLQPLPGSITGVVNDVSTSAPIANATVSYTVSGVTTSATTNSSGVYTMANVPEGTYSLTASAATYTSSAPVSVTVGPGATATQNFSLQPLPGSISGTVTDAGSSAPITNATVSYTVSGVTTSATTNSSGVYTLANVPEGTYSLTASATNYSSLTRSVVVGAGASVTQNFALSLLPGSISGTVTDASTTTPIGGATVSYSGGVTTTNATGSYTLANVPPGTYTVTANAANYTSSAPVSVTVGPGATTTQNFSLAPLPGSITGTVTDSVTAKAITNATVSYVVSGVTTSATTNASGVYTLTNVPEGSYSLTASAANYTSSAPVSVTVGPGATATQNFSLQPLPGSISGTVADAGTSAPIPNATVSYTVSGVTTSATTNSSGVYTLANVAEGTYSLTASATNYTSLTRSVGVGAGASVTQNFALSLLPGSVSGTVTDSVTAKVIVGATISYSGGSATTNASGAYTLANVPPGTYPVTASAANYTSSAPVSVTVGPGASTTQNFSLAPLPGSITGTVTDSVTAKVIAGATVSYSGGSATTNASGVYTLANVPEGTYSLTASAATYTSSAPVSVTMGPGAAVTQNFSLSSAAAPPIFSDGFESGNMASWDSGSAGLVVQSATVHSGTFAAEGSTTVGNTYARKTLAASYTNLYYRIFFYLKSHTGNVSLMWYRPASGSILHMYVDTSNNLGLRNDVALTATSSIPVTLNAWHSLEVHAIISGTSSRLEIWLDGNHVTALESATINLGTNPINMIQLGENNSGRIYDVVFDDVAVQASRIGP